MMSCVLLCPDCINLIWLPFWQCLFSWQKSKPNPDQPLLQYNYLNLPVCPDSLKFSFHHFWTIFLCKRVSNQCTQLGDTLKVTWFITKSRFYSFALLGFFNSSWILCSVQFSLFSKNSPLTTVSLSRLQNDQSSDK